MREEPYLPSLMDLCHLKNSESEPEFQKYKGRVVHRGDIVKDDSGSCAVFTEQGSSASQREIEAGWQPLAVKFHYFLNALAGAKMGKQPGSDGVVVEVVLLAGRLFCGCISCSWCVWVVGRLRDLMLGVR